MSSPLVRKRDLIPSRDVSFENDGLFLDYSPTLTIALCQEVYPDFCTAKISSYYLGTKIVKYKEDAGIRAGDDVVVEIASGVPTIIRKMEYGYIPENSLIVDFGRNDGRFVYKNKNTPPWGETEGEHLSSRHCIVKHSPGEKFISVDIAALHIGHHVSRLFYGPNSRIEAFFDNINIISKSVFLESSIGRVEVEEYEDGQGAIAVESFTTKGNIKNFSTREFRGDVGGALREKDISFISDYGATAILDFSNIVYLFFVHGPGSVEGYSQKGSIVSHEYINRELKISGEQADGGVTLNELTAKASLIPESSLDHSAIVMRHNGEEFPVTYLRGVDALGNVFEFCAGVKHEVCMQKREVCIGSYNQISVADKNIITQGNTITTQYPVKNNTYSLNETFGVSIGSYKGDVVDTYYRRETVNRINKTEVYEVDDDSDIPCMCRSYVPTEEKYQQSLSTVFQDMSAASKIEEHTIFKEGEDSVIHRRDIQSALMDIQANIRGESFSLSFSPNHLSIQAGELFSIDAIALSVSAKNSIFQGKGIFTEGLYASGDFNISATNIYMEAERNIYFSSSKLFATMEYDLAFSFGKRLSMSCSGDVAAPNKNQGVFLIDNDKVFMSTDNFYIYGEKAGAVFAKDQLSMGSKNTSISGLDLW